ncbi:MAG: hypothetical protein JST27_05090 [Bacteroidetes bacterium]|nr:hypothetical protein [Bacteroidota bacterium]
MKRNFTIYFLSLVIGVCVLNAYRMARTETPYDKVIRLAGSYTFHTSPIYYTHDHANTSDYAGVLRMALAPTPVLFLDEGNMKPGDTCFFLGSKRTQIPSDLHLLQGVIVQDSIQIAVCTVL